MSHPDRLLLIVLIIACSCKKKNAVEAPAIEPAPAASPPATVYTYDTIYDQVALDTALAPYYKFKDGSYWVYSDEKGVVVDSLVLESYAVFQTTIQTINTTTPTPYVVHKEVRYTTYCDAVSYKMHSYMNGAVKDLRVSVTGHSIFLSGFLSDVALSSQWPFMMGPGTCTDEDYDRFEGADCKTIKDSVTLGNGTKYLKPSSVFHSVQGEYAQFIHANGPSLRSRSLWVPALGPVQFEVSIKMPMQTFGKPFTNYQLIRHKVEPR